MTVAIDFKQASFSFPAGPTILANVDLHIPASKYVCVVGESGSGKTTLLRLIAGLQQLNSGTLSIGGVKPGEATDVQLVFQDYSRSLLPWLSVEKNIALGLGGGAPRKEHSARVAELLEIMNLPGTARRLPHELSGGMQQRVALARALAADPHVLLLDEPFGALDTPTKIELQEEIQRICSEHALTAVHVTHDLDEACFLSDIIVIVKHGASPKVLRNELPRPRQRLATRESQDFLSLRRALFQELGYA